MTRSEKGLIVVLGVWGLIGGGLFGTNVGKDAKWGSRFCTKADAYAAATQYPTIESPIRERFPDRTLGRLGVDGRFTTDAEEEKAIAKHGAAVTAADACNDRAGYAVGGIVGALAGALVLAGVALTLVFLVQVLRGK
jgi:hypothetical protein